MGGNVFYGSAPIERDVVEVLKICLCVPIIFGYGQTEVCGAAFISSCYDSQANHVGGPIKCLEIK